MTGFGPTRGRPRFFRITIFESDIPRVLQQNAHAENPAYETRVAHLSYYEKGVRLKRNALAQLVRH